MLRAERCVLLLILTLLTGCQFALGGVEVKPVHSSVQKPSNIAIYVAIKDGDRPLTDLDESNFAVFENDKLLDKSQAQLRLLDQDTVTVHHVLLLLDLSGDLDASTEKQLASAVEGFVQAVGKTQSVSVFGFDGSTEIRPLGEYQAGHSGEVRLSGLRPGDPSRNLNGAVRLALKRLDAQLMRIKRPVRVGTLVVFTRGPDVAGRETGDAVYDALDRSPYDAFSIGVKAKDTYFLDDVGPSGKVEAESSATLGPAFQEAARLVNDARARHYLIQYCSPARAGTPTLRLEVKYVNKAGEERMGDLELGFDASGFGPGCDSKSTPSFQTSAKDPWDMETAPAETPAPKGTEPANSSTPSSPSTPASPSTPPTNDADDDEDAIVPPPDKPGYE